ncbi:MAG: hypothetical protein EB116_17030 [Betaproteobacteria bacterium]|nr:hypothetical protein [Betaproteobacteria bacterium]
MPIIFANNAVSTLAASITSSALSCSVAAGDGNLFPLPLAGEYYLVTLTNTAGSIEIEWKCSQTVNDAQAQTKQRRA